MKTCWQILEIESTTQIDIIRQAYLARLPLCHPETDPQGFKALRQAYEEALRLAVNPVEEADDEEKDAAAELAQAQKTASAAAARETASVLDEAAVAAAELKAQAQSRESEAVRLVLDHFLEERG